MGSIFEDLFAEMRNGVRQNGGSSNIIDIIDQNNIRYSLKTISIETQKLPVNLLGEKEILIPLCRLAKEKIISKKRKVNLDIIKENMINYYNNISSFIDKQVFLIRIINNNPSEKSFLYWESNFDLIKPEELSIILRKKPGGSHFVKSDINLYSDPSKLTWNSASSTFRTYNRVPIDADIITINMNNSKLNWNKLNEGIKYIS